MKTLYTGFKGMNNASSQLVSALNGSVVLLTNSFQGIERDIAMLDEKYDSVIMTGIDPTLTSSIRLENCAEYYGEKLYSAFPVGLLTARCDEMKISYHLSSQPTKYLCNAAYWHMLRKNQSTIFIHIPSIKRMDSVFMNSLVELLK